MNPMVVHVATPQVINTKNAKLHLFSHTHKFCPDFRKKNRGKIYHENNRAQNTQILGKLLVDRMCGT